MEERAALDDSSRRAGLAQLARKLVYAGSIRSDTGNANDIGINGFKIEFLDSLIDETNLGMQLLWNKGCQERWYDGDQELGKEISEEVLAPYGEQSWEVAATMQLMGGATHKIILKRRRSAG